MPRITADIMPRSARPKVSIPRRWVLGPGALRGSMGRLGPRILVWRFPPVGLLLIFLPCKLAVPKIYHKAASPCSLFQGAAISRRWVIVGRQRACPGCHL